jgi:hypothetical protein
MISWLKVFWHCLFRTLKGCSMCHVTHRGIDGDYIGSYRFCSCGYLHPEGKTWEQVKASCFWNKAEPASPGEGG